MDTIVTVADEFGFEAKPLEEEQELLLEEPDDDEDVGTPESRSPVVTVMGHVDHGKTTLVKSLTGTDTDRLKEEKARGLTIDLGFAYTNIGNDRIGFVDVPGHHRFIHNMVAGIAGHTANGETMRCCDTNRLEPKQLPW